MKKEKWLNLFYKLLAAILLAGEAAVAADVLTVLKGGSLPVSVFATIAGLVVAVCFLLRRFNAKRIV